MAEGRAKIIIDADAAALIGAAIKAGNEIEKVGKKSKTIGDEFGRALTKVELIKKALSQVARGFDEVTSKAEAASRAAGGNRVGFATSFAELGVTDIDRATDGIRNSRGATSLEERESFVSSLADQQRRSRSRISPDDAEYLAKVYTAGGDIPFGKGGRGIIEGIERGLSPQEAVAEAMRARPGAKNAFLPGGVNDELRLRDMETYNRVAGEDGGAVTGMQARIGESALSREGLKDPTTGFAQGVLSPVRGALGQVKGYLEADDFLNASHEMNENLRRIARDAARPALAPGVE